MEKDKSILYIIEKLRVILTLEGLEFVDYWSADMCSIGITKGDKLVYISTYNLTKTNEYGYDYDFELIDESDEFNFKIIKETRGVQEDDLILDIKLFLSGTVNYDIIQD